jgi:hypothetical protein
MTKAPPVPPDNRSPKGPTTKPDVHNERSRPETETRKVNPAQQGQRANIRQNTTNQGYQQDR